MNEWDLLHVFFDQLDHETNVMFIDCTIYMISSKPHTKYYGNLNKFEVTYLVSIVLSALPHQLRVWMLSEQKRTAGDQRS